MFSVFLSWFSYTRAVATGILFLRSIEVLDQGQDGFSNVIYFFVQLFAWWLREIAQIFAEVEDALHLGGRTLGLVEEEHKFSWRKAGKAFGASLWCHSLY